MTGKDVIIGESDFKMLRLENGYYIDKSLFIKDVIDGSGKVTLITRPRRFGKTLNMSMLRYYFDCTQKDNKELFEGLKIMEQGEEYTSKLGAYPVFYHAFVLGMLVALKDTYYVNSNRESGFGRYDIMLEPKDKNGNAFIMEFKVLENLEENTIEDTIQNAKNQIEQKGYEQDLKMRGFINITKMVYAFKGKEVKMEVY